MSSQGPLLAGWPWSQEEDGAIWRQKSGRSCRQERGPGAPARFSFVRREAGACSTEAAARFCFPVLKTQTLRGPRKKS